MGRIKDLLSAILYILIILFAQKIVYYMYSLALFRYAGNGSELIRQFYPDSQMSDTEMILDWLHETGLYTLILGWILGLVLIILLSKLTKQELLYGAHQRLGMVNLLMSGIIGFGVMFLTNGLMVTLEWFVPLPEVAYGYEHTGMPFWSVLLIVGILVPVVEEVLYRGYILGKLMESGGETYSVILQAVLFGVSHLDFGQGLSVVILGLVCGFATTKTESIKAGIMIHCLFNLTNLYLYQVDLQLDAVGQLLVLTLLGGVLIKLGFEKLHFLPKYSE